MTSKRVPSRRTIVYILPLIVRPAFLLIPHQPFKSSNHILQQILQKISNNVPRHLFNLLTSLANILTSKTHSSIMDKVGGVHSPPYSSSTHLTACLALVSQTSIPSMCTLAASSASSWLFPTVLAYTSTILIPSNQAFSAVRPKKPLAPLEMLVSHIPLYSTLPSFSVSY